MSTRSLLVLGGSGFVGKSIVRAALTSNWNVVSVQRTPVLGDRVNGVSYVAGNALDPTIYRQIFEEHPSITAVVHSMGVLVDGGGDRSYARVNRDSAIIAAEETRKNVAVKSFVYLSAADVNFVAQIVMKNYFISKKETEAFLIKNNLFKNTVIARPPFMYGPEKKWSLYAAPLFNVAHTLSLGFAPKGVSVEAVADKIIETISKPIPTENKITTLEF